MTAFPRKSLLRLPSRRFLAIKPRCPPTRLQNSLAKQEPSLAEKLGSREVGCRWMNHQATKETGAPTLEERVSRKPRFPRQSRAQSLRVESQSESLVPPQAIPSPFRLSSIPVPPQEEPQFREKMPPPMLPHRNRANLSSPGSRWSNCHSLQALPPPLHPMPLPLSS